MSSLSQALEHLYKRRAYGIKLGLDTVTALLNGIGNPQHCFDSIHIAGTNGKGSVCAMLESILRSGSRVTGQYTSPHLVQFNERIRVNGETISDEGLGELIGLVDESDRNVAARPGLRAATFFEYATAMAFEHFRRSGVEVAVLETGLGGRLDATNVVTPVVSVITSISLDHAEYLGHTVEEVAQEKCGIIKDGRPVICGATDPTTRDVVGRVARERKATVIYVDEAVSIQRLSQDLSGQTIKIETGQRRYAPIRLPLLGRHQVENAACAIAAAEYLEPIADIPLDELAIRQGLESVGWPARCQVLSRDPPVLLDAAHNPAGAKALLQTAKELANGRPLAFVTSFSRDKDCRGVFQVLADDTSASWVVRMRNERGMEIDDMLAAAQSAGMEPVVLPLEQAMEAAHAWASSEHGMVCIAGSIYLAGEVLETRTLTLEA